MAATKESILDKFPFPVTPKIIGEPNFESLREVQRKLSNNAGSIQTNLGGGQHGYLALTVRPDIYFGLTGQVFAPPNDPGPYPIIPPGATNAQINAIERTQKENQRVFNEFNAVGNALKQQLLRALDETYLRCLGHNIVGFLNMNVLQMIYYLIIYKFQ